MSDRLLLTILPPPEGTDVENYTVIADVVDEAGHTLATTTYYPDVVHVEDFRPKILGPIHVCQPPSRRPWWRP